MLLLLQGRFVDVATVSLSILSLIRLAGYRKNFAVVRSGCGSESLGLLGIGSERGQRHRRLSLLDINLTLEAWSETTEVVTPGNQGCPQFRATDSDLASLLPLPRDHRLSVAKLLWRPLPPFAHLASCHQERSRDRAVLLSSKTAKDLL